MIPRYAYDVHPSIPSKLAAATQHIHQASSVPWDKCEHVRDRIGAPPKILLSIRPRLYPVSRSNFEGYILLLQSDFIQCLWMKEPKPEGVQHYHTLLFCTYSWMTQQLGYTRLPQDLRQVNATEPRWVSCLAYLPYRLMQDSFYRESAVGLR